MSSTVAEKAECWREVLKMLALRAADGGTAGSSELEGDDSVTKREPALFLGYAPVYSVGLFHLWDAVDFRRAHVSHDVATGRAKFTARLC